jgi:hypothetical protein
VRGVLSKADGLIASFDVVTLIQRRRAGERERRRRERERIRNLPAIMWEGYYGT